MDAQLIVVALCIAGAAFFIIRRMVRAVNKGQCGCGCDGCGSPGKPKDMACCPSKNTESAAEAQRLEATRINPGSRKDT